MDDQLINRIAALLDTPPGMPGREERLAEILREDEAARILAISQMPETAAPATGAGLPFPVSATLRVGVQGEFFRLFDHQAVAPTLRSNLVAQAIGRVAGSQLPLCFRRVLEIGYPDSKQGCVRIENRDSEGKLDLSFGFERGTPQRGERLEFWLNGVCVRNSPLGTVQDKPLKGVDSQGVWAFRRSSQLGAIAVRTRPIEFKRPDWIAASLACALEGDFSEASRILGSRVFEESWDIKRAKLESFLETVKSIATVQSGCLVPLPATRSGQVIADRREKVRQSLEQNLSHLSTLAPGGSEWETLSRTLRSASSGGALPAVPGDFQSEGARAAIRVHAGWQKAVEGDFAQALAELESAPRIEDDPFNLVTSIALVRHLAGDRGQVDPTEDQTREASDRVWQNLYAPLLSPIPNQ